MEMAGHKHLRSWSVSDNCESFFQQEEHLFSLLDQSLSLDYNFFSNPFTDFQTHTCFSSHDSIVNPISTSFVTDHMLMTSLDLEAISTFPQDVLSGMWNEITCNENDDVKPKRNEISKAGSIVRDSNMEMVDGNKMKETKNQNKKHKRRDGSVAKTLSRETISQYYYMPITKAAKELNIGVTALKKRCRDLGIPRWPHRKLMSLDTLKTNLEDHLARVEGERSKSQVRKVIELLKKEMKMIEEDPNLEFEDKTKRLRQACFKAKYKRKQILVSTTTTTN